MSGAVALEGLAPVGLAELEETAALLARVDRKYLLPRAQIRLVLGLLRYCHRRSYHGNA